MNPDKAKAIDKLVATLERGYTEGKINVSEIWALGLLLDARKYKTPDELVRKHVAAVTKVRIY